LPLTNTSRLDAGDGFECGGLARVIIFISILLLGFVFETTAQAHGRGHIERCVYSRKWDILLARAALGHRQHRQIHKPAPQRMMLSIASALPWLKLPNRFCLHPSAL
jgi:hypothetical protein